MTGSKNIEKLVEYYHANNLAHAYLISTNNIPKCLETLLNAIKNIFCEKEYKKDCNECSLCHLIDINNLPSLKIITPDGIFIKKEQILELKYLFSKSNLYTKEAIYIILNAEKLNKESANTMLKFLEEPDGNVIGFFITQEKDNVIATIQSRCEFILANFDNSPWEKYNLTEEEYNKYYELAVQYLSKIEEEKKKLIIYNRELWKEYSKDEIKTVMQIILDIYNHALENRFISSDKKALDFLKNLTNKNIYAKIKLIIRLLNEINYNINLDLFLDKFVIEMDGINNENL